MLLKQVKPCGSLYVIEINLSLSRQACRKHFSTLWSCSKTQWWKFSGFMKSHNAPQQVRFFHSRVLKPICYIWSFILACLSQVFACHAACWLIIKSSILSRESLLSFVACELVIVISAGFHFCLEIKPMNPHYNCIYFYFWIYYFT